MNGSGPRQRITSPVEIRVSSRKVRGEIGGFIDDEVPAGHTFAIFHDAFVDMAVPVGMSWGLSYKSADYLFNIPSMPGMYIIAVEAELYNSLIKMRDKLRDKKRDRDGGLGRRK